MRPTTTRTILMTALVSAMTALSVHADSIVLRASARAPQDRKAITLGDIAQLEGAEAEKHAGLVIAKLQDAGAIVTLRLADIRAALDAAEVNWAKVNLNGRDVLIRPRVVPGTTQPQAMKPISITNRVERTPKSTKAEPQAIVASSLAEEGSLRSAIASLLINSLQVDAANLQLLFDDRDAEVLATSDPALRFQIDPITSLRSDRVAFSIVIWRGAQVERKATVTVQPYLAVSAADAVREISRGDKIRPEDLAVRTTWVRPSFVDRVANPDLAGKVATRALDAGTTLTQRDVAGQTVIERGDRVLIRCLSGGIVINFEAEARDHGAVGERIEFRKVGERETFLAVVSAKGEAVLDLRRETTANASREGR